MKVNGKRVLLCNCEGSMALDAKALGQALEAEAPFIHSNLCRAQIEQFQEAATSGESLLICCTQEATMFEDAAADVEEETGTAGERSYVNIRERAGWSEQGAKATAKIAALIAEAATDIMPAPAVTLNSEGRILVYGDGAETLEAATRLAGNLDVTCLLRKADDVVPPASTDFPIFTGKIVKAKGHLGDFQLTVDGFAAADPTARGTLSFGVPENGQDANTDLILDLTGGMPMFPAPEKRDGYLRAAPSDVAGLQRTLFDAADLIGEFEKPRFIKFDAAICAHSRNQQRGCMRCLSACPTNAIQPAGDHVAIDEKICAGHGSCASVCPTGAIRFDVPSENGVFERLRVLLRTHAAAGGQNAVVLLHDGRTGQEMLDMSARLGRGLPANVLPFVLSEVTQVGIDLLFAAFAYGAADVRVLATPEHKEQLDPQTEAVGLANMVMDAQGFGADRAGIIDVTDPMALEDTLYGLDKPAGAEPASFKALGNKRQVLGLALGHLHTTAPSPVDVLALPQGAPFGEIQVDKDKCTLCLSCVGACPAKALTDNPDHPQLSFTESMCVQCGLCRTTCPENAIALNPQLTFGDKARARRILHEEEPFHCTRCGKPFANKSAIDHMTKKLADHPMFGGEKLELLKMCEDCRVVVQFEAQEKGAPMAGGARPTPRTTDDYLSGRIKDDD